MAADTNSPLLGLLLQGTGNNSNAWGTNLNESVITLLETAVADGLAIATTGGTLTLTATQARYQTIRLTGNLASDLEIVVPDTNKAYRIINATVGGGYFTRLKCTTAATLVSIPAGSKMTTVMAISGVPYRQDSPDVGRYVFDAASATGDVLECTGASHLRTALPELFAKIGVTYGSADALHFTLPDAYTLGKFLRSRTAAVAVGTAQTNQNKSHTHTGSGTTGSDGVAHTHTFSGTTAAMSANASHTHSLTNGTTVIYGNTSGSGIGGGGAFGVQSNLLAVGSTNTDHTHTYSGTTSAESANLHTHSFSFTTSTGSADGTEARPESLVGVLCIRY